MPSVKIWGDSENLSSLLESKGISILSAKSFQKPSYTILQDATKKGLSIKKEKSTFFLESNQEYETLASALTLEAILTGAGINFTYNRNSPERFSTSHHQEKGDQKILIIGCGGIGSNTALTFAKTNTPFSIIDIDRIEKHNTQAQPYFKSYIGWKKTDAIQKLAPCKAYDGKIEDHPNIIRQYDTIISCVDNWPARIFINKKTRGCSKKLINASVTATQASIEHLKNECLSCSYQLGKEQQHCNEVQNLFAMNFIAGALAAHEALSTLPPVKNTIKIINTGKEVKGYLSSLETRRCVCSSTPWH